MKSSLKQFAGDRLNATVSCNKPMPFNIEAVIWYAILLDSIGANIVAWFCNDWYREKFKTPHKYFPATKGWCFAYLILVLWVGCVLYRLKVLPW